MATVRDKILNKYNPDISKENLFKLYKIDKPDITSEELELKFKETKKRWKISINGANEKNAERDRERLEKSGLYEKLLTDPKLRKELYDYYFGSKGRNCDSDPASGEVVAFAEDYFKLISTTKRITREDVKFFFDYYQSERKNKKAILSMLSKKFKIAGLGKEGSYKDEETDIEGEKKGDRDILIVNLFQEATILNLRRVIEKYDEIKNNRNLYLRYPKLGESLYAFLEIDGIEDVNRFKESMTKRGKEAYTERQERGTEYVPLVDIFNILQDIADYRDVVDNFNEFKLLIKYPKLTPYMYAFVNMKPDTVKCMTEMAKRDYAFRDTTDFILNYYELIYDNFGINNNSIDSIIKKAKRKTAQNKVLNEIEKKLGRDKQKGADPIRFKLIYWLVYWPVFLLYLVFELPKFVFTKLCGYRLRVFAAMFLLTNLFLNKYNGHDIISLFKVTFFDVGLERSSDSIFSNYIGLYADVNTYADLIILIVMLLMYILVAYVLPAFLLTHVIRIFTNDFNKRFDWMGIERTFKNIMFVMHKKNADDYKMRPSGFLKRKMPAIIINILCPILIIIAILSIKPCLGLISKGLNSPIKQQEEETISEEASVSVDEMPDYDIAAKLFATGESC